MWVSHWVLDPGNVVPADCLCYGLHLVLVIDVGVFVAMKAAGNALHAVWGGTIVAVAAGARPAVIGRVDEVIVDKTVERPPIAKRSVGRNQMRGFEGRRTESVEVSDGEAGAAATGTVLATGRGFTARGGKSAGGNSGDIVAAGDDCRGHCQTFFIDGANQVVDK